MVSGQLGNNIICTEQRGWHCYCYISNSKYVSILSACCAAKFCNAAVLTAMCTKAKKKLSVQGWSKFTTRTKSYSPKYIHLLLIELRNLRNQHRPCVLDSWSAVTPCLLIKDWRGFCSRAVLASTYAECKACIHYEQCYEATMHRSCKARWVYPAFYSMQH